MYLNNELHLRLILKVVSDYLLNPSQLVQFQACVDQAHEAFVTKSNKIRRSSRRKKEMPCS